MVRVAILAIFTFLLTSCTITAYDVRAHVWETFTGIGNETQGFGAYSYVAGKPTPRLEYLLGLIPSETTPEDRLPMWIDRSNYNVFQVPASAEDAFDLLTVINGATPDHSFEGEGPFIITVRSPIAATSQEMKRLYYVDLSTTNEDLYARVLDAYKREIVANDAAEGEFQNYILAGMNTIISVGEAFKTATLSVAQFRTLWSDISSPS